MIYRQTTKIFREAFFLLNVIGNFLMQTLALKLTLHKRINALQVKSLHLLRIYRCSYFELSFTSKYFHNIPLTYLI